MVSALLQVRPAKIDDAPAIAVVHDASWREAYRGIIPGKELERIIARRDAHWWRKAILRGSNMLVLDFEDTIAGYATYGRNRIASMPFRGEIFELYLLPEFQGLGFGRSLFEAARRDLARYGYSNILVWALKDNERAVQFYLKLGGRPNRSANEVFGSVSCPRIAFAFD